MHERWTEGKRYNFLACRPPPSIFLSNVYTLLSPPWWGTPYTCDTGLLGGEKVWSGHDWNDGYAELGTRLDTYKDEHLGFHQIPFDTCIGAQVVLGFWGLGDGLANKVCTLLQWDPEARGGGITTDPLLEHLWSHNLLDYVSVALYPLFFLCPQQWFKSNGLAERSGLLLSSYHLQLYQKPTAGKINFLKERIKLEVGLSKNCYRESETTGKVFPKTKFPWCDTFDLIVSASSIARIYQSAFRGTVEYPSISSLGARKSIWQSTFADERPTRCTMTLALWPLGIGHIDGEVHNLLWIVRSTQYVSANWIAQ